jgi:hypothetical protein
MLIFFYEVTTGSNQSHYKIPSQLLCAILMNWEVGCAIIAQIVKIVFQPLHTSIRGNWEFSSNCGSNMVVNGSNRVTRPKTVLKPE